MARVVGRERRLRRADAASDHEHAIRLAWAPPCNLLAQRAIARGQVVVSQGTHQATGEVAVMEGDTLTLSGDPVLTSPQHRMKGHEMVFKVGEKTVRCTACTVVVEGR